MAAGYKKLGITQPRLQAVCYLVGHAMVTSTLFAISQQFYNHKMLHSAFLVVCVVSAVYNGARYYNYAFGQKIAKALDSALRAEIVKPRAKDE
jgi:hypothetical protein